MADPDATRSSVVCRVCGLRRGSVWVEGVCTPCCEASRNRSETTEETYPEGWKYVVVMVSPDTREVHQVGGDAEAWSRLYGRLYGERAPRGVEMP